MCETERTQASLSSWSIVIVNNLWKYQSCYAILQEYLYRIDEVTADWLMLASSVKQPRHRLAGGWLRCYGNRQCSGDVQLYLRESSHLEDTTFLYEREDSVQIKVLLILYHFSTISWLVLSDISAALVKSKDFHSYHVYIILPIKLLRKDDSLTRKPSFQAFEFIK